MQNIVCLLMYLLPLHRSWKILIFPIHFFKKYTYKVDHNLLITIILQDKFLVTACKTSCYKVTTSSSNCKIPPVAFEILVQGIKFFLFKYMDWIIFTRSRIIWRLLLISESANNSISSSMLKLSSFCCCWVQQYSHAIEYITIINTTKYRKYWCWYFLFVHWYWIHNNLFDSKWMHKILIYIRCISNSSVRMFLYKYY